MIKTTEINATHGKECNLCITEGTTSLYVNIIEDYILISREPISAMDEDAFDDVNGKCRGFDRIDGIAYYQDFDGFLDGPEISTKLCEEVVRQIDKHISMHYIVPVNTGVLSNLMAYRMIYEFSTSAMLQVSQEMLDKLYEEFLSMYEGDPLVTKYVIRRAYRDALSQLCWDGTAVDWDGSSECPLDDIEAKEKKLLAMWATLK